MRVAICDADRESCRRTAGIVASYGKRMHMELGVREFESGKALFGETREAPDVLFLETELAGESGIEIGKRVNRIWRRCLIVYLTTTMKYAMEVYQTRHVFYALKGEFDQKVGEAFGAVFRGLDFGEGKKLVFSLNGGKELLLYPCEILYFERRKRLTEVVTEYGEYPVKDSLDEIQSVLPSSGFLRCHNSYIVYFPAVLETRSSSFFMKNGVEISVSRSYRERVRSSCQLLMAGIS